MTTTENSVAAQAGDEPMRAAFEAEYGPKDSFSWRKPDGTYKVYSLQYAWEIWQKAIASQVSPRATADVERESIAKLREMLQFALTQNECDMVLTGEECRKVSALLATTKPGA